MSRRPLADAMRIAERVVDLLRDGCERIEVAGSVRRSSSDVKDIEIVCLPKHQPDLFGGPGFDLLNEVIRLRVRERKLQWRKLRGGWGAPEPESLDERRFYALGTMDAPEPWPVDVFVVRPPAQWGPIFAIRTGPADFARKLVTAAHAKSLKCEDGRLVSTALVSCGAELQTPDERDFFAAVGVQYLPPNLRR